MSLNYANPLVNCEENNRAPTMADGYILAVLIIFILATCVALVYGIVTWGNYDR